MINKFFISGLLTVSLFLITFSCSSDDSNIITDNSAAINQITTIAKSGTWRITNYVDSGKNETSDYSGYNFTFNDDGTLTASNGTDIINGTWSVIDDSDSSSDDSSDDDDVDFNIAFATPPKFEDLSDDWDIVSASDTKIDLIDISDGNGGTDTLTFEKN